MVAQQEYDSNMRGRFTHVFLAAVVLASAALAQGPPASVTSSRFGSDGNKGGGPPASVTSSGFGSGTGGGPPASVTSPGFGNNGQNRFFFTPPTNRQFPGKHNSSRHHDFFPRNSFGGAVYAVPVPYYEPLETVEPVDDTMEQMSPPPAQYLGGPTVFDRRGSGTAAPAPVERAPEREVANETEPARVTESAPAAEQPQTLLVFKDGHHIEIQNYAIIGDMLYDMTPGHSRKVLLADLDLDATTKQNDERGIDFRLPPHAKAQ